jgi:hypothetical protein
LRQFNNVSAPVSPILLIVSIMSVMFAGSGSIIPGRKSTSSFYTSDNGGQIQTIYPIDYIKVSMNRVGRSSTFCVVLHVGYHIHGSDVAVVDDCVVVVG